MQNDDMILSYHHFNVKLSVLSYCSGFNPTLSFIYSSINVAKSVVKHPTIIKVIAVDVKLNKQVKDTMAVNKYAEEFFNAVIFILISAVVKLFKYLDISAWNGPFIIYCTKNNKITNISDDLDNCSLPTIPINMQETVTGKAR